MTVYITLTTAGLDSGPFDLYSNLDGYISAFESGINRTDLIAGYSSFLVPDYTTTIRVKSNGVLCTNYVDINVIPFTTTTTTTIGIFCNTLGSAFSFGILAGTTITNLGFTNIEGDLGLFPGSSVTGFPPGTVTGTSYITDLTARNAQEDADSAFVCLNGLTPTGSVGSDIGGTTIVPGIYTVSSSLAITGTVILDGLGDPDALFIFQIPLTFIPAVNSIVALVNSAQAGNVYWLVGSSATLNVDSLIYGNVIALTSITINTGASLFGKAIALTGGVTLDNNSIVNSLCTIDPCSV